MCVGILGCNGLNLVPFSFDTNTTVLPFCPTANRVIFGQSGASEAWIKLEKNVFIKALEMGWRTEHPIKTLTFGSQVGVKEYV